MAWQRVNEYPHIEGAYTQGLALHDGSIFESSGLYRRSFITRWELDSTQELHRQRLKRKLFGEGLTVLDDRVYVLTWRANMGLIFDPKDLQPRGQFAYTGEGWGLTNNGSQLVLSDGSARIRFIDPITWKVSRSITVSQQGRPVRNLNELEWVDGKLYANIWHSPRIVIIDPNSGQVTQTLDLASLTLNEQATKNCSECVLNGIAYDANDGTLLVTGKFWKKIYRLKIEN